MNNIYDYAAMLLTIIGILVVLTNLITEVIKKVARGKLPGDITAVLVAMVLTMVAFFGAMSYAEVVIQWYYIVAAVIVGFMVAYAAMFGFDKLVAAFARLKNHGQIDPPADDANYIQK